VSFTCPTSVSPLPGSFRASPYPPLASSAEADWLAHDRHEFRRLLLTITVRAFIRYRTNMPSADFCCEIKAPCDAFSHESATRNRSPEVSSTAFSAQPPDLQPVPLMDMDFAVTCPLVRHRMPLIRFLYIGSRLCCASFRPHLAATPLRFAMTSPPSGCQRDFHDPRAVEHARHTTKTPAPSGCGGFGFGSTVQVHTYEGPVNRNGGLVTERDLNSSEGDFKSRPPPVWY
jgi:hypothetical protein